MRTFRTRLAFVCTLAVVCLAGQVAFGQDVEDAAAPAAAPEMPKAEPVLQHVPAGAMGFAAVKDLKGLAGKIDKLIEEIGMGQMAQQQMPTGLLDMIKTQAELGDGFNPNGGFAVVMLDPQKFGIDLAKMAIHEMDLEDDADEKPEEKQLPFVFLVPGKSVESVFGNYEVAEAGKYKSIAMDGDKVFATKIGGYVALSSLAKALDAAAAVKVKAVATLPKEHVALVARNDVILHVNMKITGPIIDKIIKAAELKLEKEQKKMDARRREMDEEGRGGMMRGTIMMGGMGPGQFAKVLPLYRGIINQLGDVTVGARLGKEGVIIEKLVAIRPDTLLGKVLATYEPAGANLLNRLPNLPYVMAMGMTMPNEKGMKAYIAWQDSVQEISWGMMGKLSDEDKALAAKVTKGFSEQLTGVQLVVGGVPKDNGVVGAAYVLQCKDVAKTKVLLKDYVVLLKKVLKSALGAEGEKLSLTYQEGVETIDGVKVDMVSIDHAELANMDEEDRDKMTAILGEDKLRVLIASAGKNNVVLTFGGSKALLSEAMKVAKSGAGTIPKAEGTVKVMKLMPKKTAFVMLFNASNLFTIIKKAGEAMGQADNMPPFEFTGKTPITLGLGVDGKSAHGVAVIPKEFLKDVAGAWMTMTSMMMGGGGPGGPMPPPQGPNDF